MKLQIQDELAYRLNRSFDRLEREEYFPESVFASTDNNQQWPGDYPGRVILALVQLVRVTGRRAKHLDAILKALPGHLNARGYLGEVLPEGIFDEQQLAGHGWLVAALLAHYKFSGQEQSLALARTMACELYKPLLGRMISHYTIEPKGTLEGKHSGTRMESIRNGWRLSTDVGCAFIALEGLVPAHRLLKESWISALIEEMAECFAGLDLVAVSAQTHATLTTARNLLAWHNQAGLESLLAAAERLYRLYRGQAMTENYANYNWFNRPEWTEPCAIVDSFIIAMELWKKTGRCEYIEDAHSIYYNALGYAQKPHGGFGCDCCVGPGGPDLCNQVYDVTWCCNMRGAVGLAYAAQHALLVDEGALTLLFPFSFRAEELESSGVTIMEYSTGYPREGCFKIKIQTTPTLGPLSLRWFMPSWVDLNSVKIRVNNKLMTPVKNGHFWSIPIMPGQMSEIDARFDMPTHQESRRISGSAQEVYRYRRGPLVLAEHLRMDSTGKPVTVEESPQLQPFNDIIYLSDDEARKDRRHVLFSKMI